MQILQIFAKICVGNVPDTKKLQKFVSGTFKTVPDVLFYKKNCKNLCLEPVKRFPTYFFAKKLQKIAIFCVRNLSMQFFLQKLQKIAIAINCVGNVINVSRCNFFCKNCKKIAINCN